MPRVNVTRELGVALADGKLGEMEKTGCFLFVLFKRGSLAFFANPPLHVLSKSRPETLQWLKLQS